MIQDVIYDNEVSVSIAQNLSNNLNWAGFLILLFDDDLKSEKLKLKKPLSAKLDKDEEGNIIISNFENLDIFGYGNTEIEAREDFVKTLEDLYFEVKENKDDLSGYMSNIWLFLQDSVEEK